MAPFDAALHVLLLLAVVIALGRALAWPMRRLGQPAVMAEVLAGVLLGPSVLGALIPGASAWLLPPAAAFPMELLAQAGVVLYLFQVGLEVDGSALRAQAKSLGLVAAGSLATPFILGLATAPLLWPQLAGPRAHAPLFYLFVAVAMSVTAFPVLARLLSDQGLTQTRLGRVALGAAALADVAAWALLAVIAALAQREPGRAWLTPGLFVLFLAGMGVLGRPVLALLARRTERWAGVALLLLAGLGAWTTHLIGVHAAFGAFVVGLFVPHDSPLAQQVNDRIPGFVAQALMPAFFAWSGLRTHLGLIDDWQGWVGCAGLVVVAVVGKVGGTRLVSSRAKLEPREGLALGLLLNTRGLVELVVLNVGLDLGLLSPRLFAMLVVMALATTFSTVPLLRRLTPEFLHPRPG
ncbi:MAG: cation:proton antiporter [Myxococcales bacterium]